MGTSYTYDSKYFSGSNVSIMLGPHLLTQAAGIVWQSTQNKRPIYGYNSQYYDALSNGTYLLTGQLYVNFTHTNYIPTMLKRYHIFRNGARSLLDQGRGADLIDWLHTIPKTRALIDVVREMVDPEFKYETNPNGTIESDDRLIWGKEAFFSVNKELDSVDMLSKRSFEKGTATERERVVLYTSASQRQKRLDVALDHIFENPHNRTKEDLISFFTGGAVSSENLELSDNGIVINRSGTVSSANEVGSIIERNRHRAICGNDLMEFARADQFGDGSQGPVGIDMMVHFGSPGESQWQPLNFNYAQSSSYLLKGISFNGEAMQIMNDDSGLMEVYSFIARKKEVVVRSANI